MAEKRRRSHKGIDDFVGEYAARRPRYEEFTRRLQILLQDLLERDKIRFDSVTGRAKAVESFRDKAIRSGKKYADPLSDITDLAGLRVVLYYTDDVDVVCKLIEREFEVDTSASVDKRQELGPNEFGYVSVHYVVSLRPERAKLAEWSHLSDVSAEIQIRTVLQHAWASISHALQYKQERDAPAESRRRLSRLSSLLELADEQFCSLRREQRAAQRQASKSIERGDHDLDLDLPTLREFLKQSDVMQKAASTARKVGFDMMKGDEYASELLSDCGALGVATIGDLEEELRKSETWLEGYLAALLRIVTGDGSGGWMASVSFIAALVLYRSHRDRVTPDYLLKNEWDPVRVALVTEVLARDDLAA